MNKLIAIILCLPLLACGSEITRSITFQNGQRLQASDLHTLIDGATINTTFLTGQTLETSLAGGDYFLVYSPTYTGWRKITATAALYNNTAIITSQSEKTAPTAADYLWLYDAAGGQMAKVSWGTLASNVNYTFSFTNLANHLTPTNNDKLLIFSDTYGSNRVITLAGLITNLPALGWGTNAAGAAIQLTNTDTLPIFSTIVQSNGLVSNIVSKVTLGQLSNSIVGATLETTNITITAGNTISIPHGLSTTPRTQWILVCVTNTGRYEAGDQVDVSSVIANNDYGSSYSVPAFCGGANTTNLFLSYYAGSLRFMVNKGTNSILAFDTSKWKVKGYAR